jgi:predicted Zn-dependent protease
MFVVRSPISVFLIGYVDYDPNFNFNPTAELDENRDNFVKGVKATLISNKRTTVDGYQAIEFVAETAEKIFKSRVYMVGRRPYQLVTVTSKGVDDSVNINRFFGSFKVRVR